jgi:hypothetical protein
MLRSLTVAVLALAMTACEPDVTPDGEPTEPTTFVTAVFDPTTSQIPLPNDLVFLSAANNVCPASANRSSPVPACTQADLLVSFSHYAPANAPAFSGEFPNDQEVAITIDFTQTHFDATNHQTTKTAPDLDLATLTDKNLFVVHTPIFGPQEEMPLDPLTDSNYVTSSDGTHATLTIHHQGRTPWPPGSYAVVMRRGGVDKDNNHTGVYTKAPNAIPVTPSQIFYLLAQDKSLTDPANLGLLKAQTGSTEEALKQGTQLEVLRLMYDASAFPIADAKFPRQELAIAVTFKIAPEVTNVEIDPARGKAPLPIDLLRDLDVGAVRGHLTDLAACTLVGAPLDGQGKCTNPAAAGFKALDGFSTTGAILGPTSDLVRASTVTGTSLLLYDVSDRNNPKQVPPSSLIIEPCEFTSACGSSTALSPVIAIQPAGATAVDPPGEPLRSVFRTKPLKDNTDYAVVVTTAILDKAGNPLGSGTAAKLLKFSNPVLIGGHAAVPGLDDATATALEDMRAKLKPLLDQLAAAGTDRGKIAIAYTFHTQTILSQGVGLAALPYTGGPNLASKPGPVTAEPVATGTGNAFTKFGVNPAIPHGQIEEILEVDIDTFNALDAGTGAFRADVATLTPAMLDQIREPIHVLIAMPKATNPNVPACAFSDQLRCAPMVIFRHGLTRGRADMLLIADSLAAAGMVTVAIDAAKHGDRSFCTSGTTGAESGCAGGGACTTGLPAGAQGDLHPPGTCAAGFVKRPVTTGATGNTDGIAAVSGNYLVSANFFRTRDSMRQDLIDESQLIRALVFAPTNPPTPHTVFDHMSANGLVINPVPGNIYYAGQSLGAIQGVANVATNPRISKAVFNVGGGTLVDIFTNSPAFAPQVNALLAGLGITRGTSQYLQFLVVAKTVLDPADPINFAGHLTDKDNMLPNLLANPNGTVLQTPKKILSQMANCDDTVPNPFSFVYASNISVGPLPSGAAFFQADTTGTFQLFVTTPFNPATFGACPSASGVGHGFLLNFANPTLTGNAQNDLARFLRSDTIPLRVQHQ